MTSVQPADQIPLRTLILDRIPTTTTVVRFNSARVAPQWDEDFIVSSPVDLRIDERLNRPNDGLLSASPTREKAHLTSRITPLTNRNNSERVVKISEYRAPENTPFQPLTSKLPPKKLHRYILLTPHTIFSFTLLTILSAVIVFVGFGIAISNRRAQLNFQCSSISYCPRNISYTISCNITNEYCGCYDTEDQLIGCLQQRKYGEGCYRSQECSLHQNLQCNLTIYQCQCLDHYFYNGSLCIPMLTYGATCSILNDTCDYLLNLTCLIGNICTCDTNITFWNGQYCEYYRTVGSPCDPTQTPSGCSMIFTCDNSSATCQCPSSTYFDGEVCLAYSSYLEPCYDISSCLPNTQLTCSWGLCLCDDLYYYWSSLTFTCTYPKQITYNSTCDYQTSCESDYGLYCINSRCSCELNSYWTPGNYCDVQSQYNEQCLTAPCLANSGLFCSSNICTCPQYYYWDGYVCQYQRTYTGFCLSDSWCRNDLGLRCRSLTCTCSLCTTCFWDGVRCRDCPTSWQIVVSNGPIQPRVYCYLKVNSYVNWNESLASCSTAATSYFGNTSHLIYIDDFQELQDVSTFATTVYYDIFIGHTNQFNYTRWFLSNGTVSPTMNWCTGVATSFAYATCARLLISSLCATDITCYGWTSRYICELD